MNEHYMHYAGSAYGQLIALRRKLAAFRTMPCRLLHEKAVDVTENVYSTDPDYPGLSIRRRGFCTKELRHVTLGCAHTVANVAFTALVSELNKITGTPAELTPWPELPGAIMSIYKLDHEKGSLEKQLAVLGYLNSDQEQQWINDRLHKISGEHDQAVAQLETIRQDVLMAVDRQIALCASAHQADVQ